MAYLDRSLNPRPDITVHEGKLVWSCRLEEYREFGTLLTAAPSKRRSLELAEPQS